MDGGMFTVWGISLHCSYFFAFELFHIDLPLEADPGTERENILDPEDGLRGVVPYIPQDAKVSRVVRFYHHVCYHHV